MKTGACITSIKIAPCKPVSPNLSSIQINIYVCIYSNYRKHIPLICIYCWTCIVKYIFLYSIDSYLPI